MLLYLLWGLVLGSWNKTIKGLLRPQRDELLVVWNCVCYLLLFSIKLKAFIQCAAVLLDMLLLLSTYTLTVPHHLLLNVTKETTHTHTSYKTVVFLRHYITNGLHSRSQ